MEEKINKKPIDFGDDDGKDYNLVCEELSEVTNHQKNQFASEISVIGETLLEDIQWRKNQKNKEKLKYVKYIVKKTDRYHEDDLILYELDYIIEIYKKTKKENSWLSGILDMLK